MNELTPASRCEWNATGLTLPEGLTFEEWSGLGDALAHQANGLMWWIGDWWLYGEHRYGEQASQAPALGLKPDTLSNAAAVASRVQMPRRRGNLTFSHHQAIAYLEPEVADALLTQAEAALEERQKRRDTLGAVRSSYNEAHAVAMKGLGDLGLKDGMVMRIGRFRITQQPVAERSVSFDVTQSHRVRIDLAD